jgi:MFS family permease
MANAIVLGQISQESSRVIGTGVAGILIGAVSFGTEAVFLIGSLLFASAVVTVLGLPPGLPKADRQTGSPWSDLAAGLAYVRSFPSLKVLVLTSLGVVMIGFPYMTFLPAVSKEVFSMGAGGYAMMSMATAIGAVVAGLFAARLAGEGDPWRLLATAGLVFGVATVLLGVSPWFGTALLVLPFVGAAGLTFQTTNQSLLLTLSDPEYHGRIMSLVMLGFSGYGLAALPLGLLADVIGLRTTFVLMGVATVAVVLVFTAVSRTAREVVPVLDFA